MAGSKRAGGCAPRGAVRWPEAGATWASAGFHCRRRRRRRSLPAAGAPHQDGRAGPSSRGRPCPRPRPTAGEPAAVACSRIWSSRTRMRTSAWAHRLSFSSRARTGRDGARSATEFSACLVLKRKRRDRKREGNGGFWRGVRRGAKHIRARVLRICERDRKKSVE